MNFPTVKDFEDFLTGEVNTRSVATYQADDLVETEGESHHQGLGVVGVWHDGLLVPAHDALVQSLLVGHSSNARGAIWRRNGEHE